MASAVIDALLQSTAPPRPPEPAAKSADGGSFKPALDEAIRAEASGAAPAASAPPNTADDDTTVVDHDADPSDWHEQAGDASTDVAETVAPAQAAGEKSADEDGEDDDEDAVEISEAAAAAAALQAITAVVDAKTVSAPAAGEATTKTVDAVEGIENKKPAPGQKAPPSQPNGAPEAPTIPTDKTPAQEAVEIADVVPDDGQSDQDNEKHGKANVVAETKGDESAKSPASRSGAEDGKHSEGHDRSQGDSLSTETATSAEEPAPKEETHRRPSAPDATDSTADSTNVAAADASAPVAAPPDQAAAAAPSPDQVAATAVASAAPADPPSATRNAPSLATLAAGHSLKTTPDGGDHGASQVDRGRFLGRVEGAIRTAQQRDGRVHVRLSPPELGALRIELTLQNGVMNAHVEAETTSARNLLLDNLPALRDRLAQQDIRVDRFDVDVRRDGGGSNPQNTNDRPTGDPNSGPRDERRRERTTELNQPRPSGRGAAPRATGNTALDVRV